MSFVMRLRKPNGEVIDDRQHKQYAVDAVEHATMAWQNTADIFDAQLAFDLRFSQITEWPDNPGDDADDGTTPQRDGQTEQGHTADTGGNGAK